MKRRDKFPLAHLLIRLGERWERDECVSLYAQDIVVIDSARGRYHGIPSILG